jgi:hypothetical protein
VFLLFLTTNLDLLRTAPQKAAHAKGEIRDRINAKLGTYKSLQSILVLTYVVDITGNPNAQMAYVNYEEDIVHKYSVEMVGWTPDKWCNPSDLSSSLPLLRTLLNAIKADTCTFVRIAPAALRARKEKYDADIAAGRITGKQRNRRSDIGKKRKRAAADDGEGDDDEDDEGNGEEGAGSPSDQPSPSGASANAASAGEPVRPSSIEEPADSTMAPAPKSRKRAKTAPNEAGAKKAAPKKATSKKVDAASTKAKPRPRAKGKENSETQRALARLAAHVPGSSGGRAAAFKSRTIVTSDDEGPENVVAAGGVVPESSDAAAAGPNVSVSAPV